MAIRDKIKAKFSKNKAPAGASPPPTETRIEGHYTGRTDIEYYKPHEIPKSKYRGRVDKDHQEKLDNFSFGDTFAQAVRRSSAALSGTFSPGGTKAFSRRTSYASTAGARTPARSRRSSLSTDTGASFSIPSSGSDSTHMRSIPAAMTPVEPNLTENAEDDTDVTNTGLSRVGTVKDTTFQNHANGNFPCADLDRQATVTNKPSNTSNSHIEHSRLPGEMPFTPEELTRAMTRASITPQITARRTSVAVL